ncbi:hypothetical protein [Maribacter sp. 2307ULW6-5]|uniref:hypothetical protein n=1 Tax=Maribacter sp. 2307ULW6-5 TaxID=3386275 RepID=UPI0039BD8F8D
MKFVVFSLFLLGCFASSQAQYVDRTTFRAGLNGGIVAGDLSEAYSFVLGLDVYQHWGVTKVLDLGLATGFSNAFGEKQELSAGGVLLETQFDNFQFVPLAASFRVYPGSAVKFGGDVGYALGINEDNGGGLYYRPSLGLDISGGSTELNISYVGVNADVSYSSFLFGVLFLF